MNAPHDRHYDDQVELLRALLEEQTSIDLDVLEVRAGIWAIHGVVPYDGESPLATFATYEEAKSVLDQICAPRGIDEL